MRQASRGKKEGKPGPRRRTVLAVVGVLVLLIGTAGLLFYFDSGVPSGVKMPSAGSSTAQASLDSSNYVVEYQIAQHDTPNDVAVAQDGEVWFTMGNESLDVLSPSNGTVRTFLVPGQGNSTLVSWGITVGASDQRVWFTDQTGNAVWSFDLETTTFTRYQLPGPRSSPYQIAEDQHGNVWFTEVDGGRLGEVTAAGALREYAVPLTPSYNHATASTGPAGIAIAPDGTIWFAEVYANSVGSFTPSSSSFHQYDLNGHVDAPTGVAVDGQGSIWITQHGASLVSRFDPITNQTLTISTSLVGTQTSLPYFVGVDQHGNVWFNEHYGNAMARFSPSNSSLVEYEIPSRVAELGNISGAVTMALSTQGKPWFTEAYTGKIGTVNTSKPARLEVKLGSSSSAGSTFTVSPSSPTSIPLTVSISGAGRVSLGAFAAEPQSVSVGFAFAPTGGTGNFSSSLTISLEAQAADVTQVSFSVTVSAEAPGIISSQVIQLQT